MIYHMPADKSKRRLNVQQLYNIEARLTERAKVIEQLIRTFYSETVDTSVVMVELRHTPNRTNDAIARSIVKQRVAGG